MTDTQPEQYPQARTYKQAVLEGDSGMRVADIFPGPDDWEVADAAGTTIVTADEMDLVNDFTQGPELRPEGEAQ